MMTALPHTQEPGYVHWQDAPECTILSAEQWLEKITDESIALELRLAEVAHVRRLADDGWACTVMADHRDRLHFLENGLLILRGQLADLEAQNRLLRSGRGGVVD